MRKILSLVLAICLVVMCIPASMLSVSADAQIYDNIAYVVDEGEAYIVDCNPEAEGTITIPNTLGGCPVTNIAAGAFSECALITKVVIPDSVTFIGEEAFAGCLSLTSVDIPVGVSSVSDYAFSMCISLESVNLPHTVVNIGEAAFSGCASLTDINLPNGLKNICSMAFAMCMSLETINIPNTVEVIDEGAFMECMSLTSVNIPASVSYIGDLAFFMCIAIESIDVSENNTEYSSDQYGVLFNKNKTMLIQYPTGRTSTSYTIPTSATDIYHFAFALCQPLKNITFHNDIVYVGTYAFLGTEWYESQPDGMIYVGKTAYGYKGECPETISIKDGTVSIAAAAFGTCFNLKNINIPSSVKVIGEMPFYMCEAKEKIV